MPSARFSHTGIATAKLDQAWAQLQIPHTWQAIPGVDEVFEPEHNSEGALSGFLFRSTAAGISYQGTAEVVSASAPSAMTLTIDSSELAGVVETALSDLGNGSIEIAVSVQLDSKGFLAGMFFAVVARIVENGLPQSIHEFAARLSR